MKVSESKYSKCLYFATGALARKVEKLALQCWQPVGLSPSHAYLLMMAIETPGIQPGVIGEHLQLTPSTITRLVEKLEEKKLVVRITEGKQTNIYATPKATALLPELKACISDFYNRYVTILGKEESTKMVQQMNNITEKIEQ